MNEHEKRKIELAILRTIAKKMAESMPEGHEKRCWQAMLTGMEVIETLHILSKIASKNGFDDQQSQQVLDYLRCVQTGLKEFCKQLGIQEAS